jgi:hypothetical protein
VGNEGEDGDWGMGDGEWGCAFGAGTGDGVRVTVSRPHRGCRRYPQVPFFPFVRSIAAARPPTPRAARSPPGATPDCPSSSLRRSSPLLCIDIRLVRGRKSCHSLAESSPPLWTAQACLCLRPRQLAAAVPAVQHRRDARPSYLFAPRLQPGASGRLQNPSALSACFQDLHRHRPFARERHHLQVSNPERERHQ